MKKYLRLYKLEKASTPSPCNKYVPLSYKRTMRVMCNLLSVPLDECTTDTLCFAINVKVIPRRQYDRRKSFVLWSTKLWWKYVSNCERQDLIWCGVSFTSSEWIYGCYEGWVGLNGSKPSLRIDWFVLWSSPLTTSVSWRSNVG